MIYGYFCKLIEIDLSTEEIKFIDLQEDVLRKYIGGSGLGAKLLYESTDSQTEPLSPENVLIFTTGPLTGTKTFSSDRYEVITKSPLTGIYLESDCGGRWGESFKKCGFDGLIIKGKAREPVYITIFDDQIAIRKATHLWGKDTFETDEAIKDEFGKDTRIVCIGQAGENLVRFAAIMNEGRHGRAAGRGGAGAVMGSKNLKAIAVKGTKEVAIANEDKLDYFVKSKTPHMIKFMSDVIYVSRYGTAGGMEEQHVLGDLPIKNWHQGVWENHKKLTGIVLTEKYMKKKYHCGRCVIGCGRTIEIKDGPYKVPESGGPEYETIGMMGTNLLVDDLAAVSKANELCNRYGLDTISTGSAIGFGMEAYERSLIGKNDTGGVDLTWGNADAVLSMIEKIAFRKDIGSLLGEGLVRASNAIGQNSVEFAVHVKGMDFPAHDPRAKHSDAIGYATSNRGACHLQAYTHDFEAGFDMADLGYPETQDRHATEGKAQMVVDFQHFMSMLDSLHICKFTIFGGMSVEPCVEALNMVTGWDFTKEEFLETGERIFNLKRLYNVREGISRKDDTLPPRILCHPRGGGSGEFLPSLNKMLRDYYRIRGWDEFGIPTVETIKRLGLEEYK